MAYGVEEMTASLNSLINAIDNQQTHKETQQQLQMSDEQFKANLAWQQLEQEKNQQFLSDQYQKQLDFANRNLNDNMAMAQKNLDLQSDIYNQNLDLMNRQFNYQKELNTTQMEREDSAIQRQIADYQKAGFSPLAAIGGNGAPSVGLSSASAGQLSAPQFDMSGVNAAAGQYADFARQYSNLAFTAKQDYINKRTELAQKHNSDITGARIALSQLRSDMRYKNQNASTQLFNALVNAKNSRLQNEYVNEQISNLKDEHEWNKIHGYRGETLGQSLIAGIRYIAKSETFRKIANDIGVSSTKFAQAVDKWLEDRNKPISEDLRDDLGTDSYNQLESISKKEMGKSIDELSPTELIKLADVATPENEKLGYKVKQFFVNLYYKGRSIIGK